jgi:hypothetical protein
MTFPGQPRSASSGFTGDRVAGCPASTILLRYLLRLAECPRLCLACLADDVSPSILGHRILRLLPAIELRVSPLLISFSVFGCSAPGVPETMRHQIRFRRLPEHPRVLHLPAVPMGIVRVAPHFLVHRRCRLVDLRVPPDFTPSGRSVSASSGCPASAATAGSMMSPQPRSNFASSGYPACESPGVPASCARWLCRG